MRMEIKQHNYFFGIFQVGSKYQDKYLGSINLLLNKDFEVKLLAYALLYDVIKDYTDVTTMKDAINLIYGENIKSILVTEFPDIALKLACILDKGTLEKDDVEVRLMTSYEYRQYNEEYDNQLKFIEYITSEKAQEDKETQITKEMLYEAGFSDIIDQTFDNYNAFRKWTTNDYSPIKIEIDNKENNRGTEWHVHIDNCDCDTIGTADIDSVWEFNTLMQVFGSKFRL